MNIRKTLLALTLAGVGVAGFAMSSASAAAVNTCQPDFIKKADTQVCSNQNLNFTAFTTTFPNPAATRLSNRLFRISVTGAGIISDGYNVNQGRISTCSTGVNRDVSGTPRVDTSGCAGLVFHRTFVQL